MPRIKADKSVKHGHHTDFYWPGAIWSIWRRRPIELRRERKYSDRNHQNLTQTSWQLTLALKGSKSKYGLRWERWH